VRKLTQEAANADTPYVDWMEEVFKQDQSQVGEERKEEYLKMVWTEDGTQEHFKQNIQAHQQRCALQYYPRWRRKLKRILAATNAVQGDLAASNRQQIPKEIIFCRGSSDLMQCVSFHKEAKRWVWMQMEGDPAELPIIKQLVRQGDIQSIWIIQVAQRPATQEQELGIYSVVIGTYIIPHTSQTFTVTRCSHQITEARVMGDQLLQRALRESFKYFNESGGIESPKESGDLGDYFTNPLALNLLSGPARDPASNDWRSRIICMLMGIPVAGGTSTCKDKLMRRKLAIGVSEWLQEWCNKNKVNQKPPGDPTEPIYRNRKRSLTQRKKPSESEKGSQPQRPKKRRKPNEHTRKRRHSQTTLTDIDARPSQLKKQRSRNKRNKTTETPNQRIHSPIEPTQSSLNPKESPQSSNATDQERPTNSDPLPQNSTTNDTLFPQVQLTHDETNLIL
jgi:hypothetical protein